MLGVDPQAFATTIANYNKYQQSKNDLEFKRSNMALPLTQAPFCSIEIWPGVHYTMGGIAINGRAQALAKGGKPIPGLYAAGEVTGGVHGANRLGGNSTVETVVFGRIAGREAAQYRITPDVRRLRNSNESSPERSRTGTNFVPYNFDLCSRSEGPCRNF